MKTLVTTGYKTGHVPLAHFCEMNNTVLCLCTYIYTYIYKD